MNRFIKIFVFIFISFFFISFPSASIVNTKHNLSVSGPGPIKAVSETEICKFCHIPHTFRTGVPGPLWNRTDPTGPWNMYNSDYLTAIGYTTPTAPSERAKLCLSCHDGTIAIGTLFRKGPIAMANNVTTMPTTAAGFLGTGLRDDHPVSIRYDPTVSGANLQSPGPGNFPTVSGMNIKLYSDGVYRYVECTSCHEPHNNVNTKFLVRPFYGGNVGAFCTTCHNLPNWTGSAHQASTVAVNAGSPLRLSGYDYGSTVGAIACMNCHDPHSSAGTPYLRRFGAAEEATCFGGGATTLPCHASGSQAGGQDRVGTQFDLANRHPITATTGAHRHYALESDVRLSGAGGTATRHVECVDCHNPHQARTQTGHQLATNTVRTARAAGMIPYRGSLAGSWGVMPTGTQDDGGTTTGWPDPGVWTFNRLSPYAPWAAGIPSTGYTKFTYGASPPTQSTKGDGTPTGAAYLCLKCHSQYAFGTSPPTTTANVSAALTSRRATDVTANFNPRNLAFHPVFMRGQNRPGRAGFESTFRTDRGIWSDSYVTCYDCHASSAAADPRGPHGSANRWILRSNETGTGDGITANFCLNCHHSGAYGDEGPAAPGGGTTLIAESRYPHDYSRVNANETAWGFASCVGCHGGGSYGGIHGSSFGAWATGRERRSERMLDGAMWLSSRKPTTALGVGCWVTTSANETGFDTACQKGHAGTEGSKARYDYPYTQYTTD